ncbi:MAG: hypothetical protein HYT35_00400 [Candidatus Staskawiczbacteria bacterium]|nr:hypothetical protein [Candidatus Staskawiczbacteria bacterium]
MEKIVFKKLPNSTRKFVRSEKARIRRQFFDYKKQQEAIANMYNKILNPPMAVAKKAKTKGIKEPFSAPPTLKATEGRSKATEGQGEKETKKTLKKRVKKTVKKQEKS